MCFGIGHGCSVVNWLYLSGWLGWMFNRTYVLCRLTMDLAFTDTESAESDPRLCRLGVNPPTWMIRIAQRFIIDYSMIKADKFMRVCGTLGHTSVSNFL